MLLKTERVDKHKQDDIIIHCDILYICNYKCSYCYARANETFNQIATKNELDNIIKNLEKIDKRISISILGGEPSLHPHLEYFIDNLRKLKNLNRIIIITNGEKRLKESIVDKIDAVIVSYHTEYAELSKFLETVVYYSNKIDVCVNAVYLRKYDELLESLYKKLKEHNIVFNMDLGHFKGKSLKTRISNWVNEYTKEIKRNSYYVRYYYEDSIKEYVDIEMSLNNVRNFKGYYCEISELTMSFKKPDILTPVCNHNEKFAITELNQRLKDKCYYICSCDDCSCQGGTLANKAINLDLMGSN